MPGTSSGPQPVATAADGIAPAAVVAGPEPSVLRAIGHERVGLALWWRILCPRLAPVSDLLLAEACFCHETIGAPQDAVAAMTALLPPPARMLQLDLAPLAALYAELAAVSAVRVRLEHLREQSCPRLHVDAVAFRMLCTYAGRGTEWQDRAGTIRRMPVGHVAMFKGTRAPGGGVHVPHRSPPVADLPRAHRGRLLLCIDRPELN